jgi:hypothetical protein
MGRRPLGLDFVEQMQGPPQAKERLMAVLESLTGELTVDQVCSAVGIGRTRFYQLRERAMYGALEALFAGTPGPKARRADEREERIHELEAKVSRLQIQLQASRVRTEIALVMPHILRREGDGDTKVRAKRRGRGRSDATTDG